jgi:hypothetical protein
MDPRPDGKTYLRQVYKKVREVNVRLVPTQEAARLLGIDADTLRRKARAGGGWVEVPWGRIRVYQLDPGRTSTRRFDADEIIRLRQRREG